MEFGTREILILLGIIILLGILLDGLRRVRHIKSRSLRVSKRKPAIFDDEGYGEMPGELPTGEVRVKVRDEQTVEAVSDNIRKYRESNTGKCTSAFRDVSRQGSEAGPAYSAPTEPKDMVAEPPQISVDDVDQPVSLDEFAIDEDVEPADAPLEPRIEPTWELRSEKEEGREPPVENREMPVEHQDSRRPFWLEEEDQADHRNLSDVESRPQPGQEPAGEPRPEPQPQEASSSGEFEVVVLHLMARKDAQFEGTALLNALLNNGLRFGDMGIFHRHDNEDGSGAVHFSVANTVKPGTFDLETMENFSTPGVTFFMTLNDLSDPLDSYGKLIKTSQAMAKTLQGERKDENRSVLTKQTIEHYRQEIIDYTRRSFTLSN
jgi:cell division protein ZipA